MFLVGLTRSSILAKTPCASAREFLAAQGWYVTCVTDSEASARFCSASDDIVVSESPVPDSASSGGTAALLEVKWTKSFQVLTVSKREGAGKSAYYLSDSSGQFFVFSDIALLRQFGFLIEEDPEVLPELLVYRSVAAPRTVFRGIRQLPLAGELSVQLRPEGCTVTVRSRGYGFNPVAVSRTGEAAVAGVTAALQNSIDRLAPVSNRVVTLLSGGVDSSLLCRLAQDRLQINETHSTCFPFDAPVTNAEQQYALSAAAALSTRHMLFVPTVSDFLFGFIEALAAAECPLHHLQSVLLHLLFKYGIPAELDTIICGEGADCAFGLDTHFRLRQPPNVRTRILSALPVYAGLRGLGSFWERLDRFNADIGENRDLRRQLSDAKHPIWNYGAYGDFAWVEEHYQADRDAVVASRCTQVITTGVDSFNDALTFYALNYGEVAVTTTVWSKLAEAQKKAVYYPFLTEATLGATLCIPWEEKLKREKHIIREAGRVLGVPSLILNRPKQSFGIVSDSWALKDGPFEPLVALASKVVDIKLLRLLQGRDPRRAMTLWSLLNYAVLKRLFVLGESRQSLKQELSEYMRQTHLTIPRTSERPQATSVSCLAG